MTTRAFDTALFVAPAPASSGDGIVVDVLGPPFTTLFTPLVQGSKSGLTVHADVPAAIAQNQILISGPGPTYGWGLGTNPAAAAAVPPATAPQQLLMADVSTTWQPATIATVLSLGGAVTQAAGGTFVSAANLVFTASPALTTRIDGGDAQFTLIDNVTIDSGQF